MMDVWKASRRVHGNVGIIAINLHIQIDAAFSHENADGSKTDDTELLFLSAHSRQNVFSPSRPFFFRELPLPFSLCTQATPPMISLEAEEDRPEPTLSRRWHWLPGC